MFPNKVIIGVSHKTKEELLSENEQLRRAQKLSNQDREKWAKRCMNVEIQHNNLSRSFICEMEMHKSTKAENENLRKRLREMEEELVEAYVMIEKLQSELKDPLVCPDAPRKEEPVPPLIREIPIDRRPVVQNLSDAFGGDLRELSTIESEECMWGEPGDGVLYQIIASVPLKRTRIRRSDEEMLKDLTERLDNIYKK